MSDFWLEPLPNWLFLPKGDSFLVEVGLERPSFAVELCWIALWILLFDFSDLMLSDLKDFESPETIPLDFEDFLSFSVDFLSRFYVDFLLSELIDFPSDSRT